MNKIPFRNMMLWLTILTLLWSSQGYGYVWCMSEEGTHLESIADNHCDLNNDSAADSSCAIFAADDSSRDHCFDLAANHDTLQHRNLASGELDLPCLLDSYRSFPLVFRSLVRHLDNNLILESPPRIATTLLVQRTIVLLI